MAHNVYFKGQVVLVVLAGVQWYFYEAKYNRSREDKNIQMLIRNLQAIWSDMVDKLMYVNYWFWEED